MAEYSKGERVLFRRGELEDRADNWVEATVDFATESSVTLTVAGEPCKYSATLERVRRPAK